MGVSDIGGDDYLREAELLNDPGPRGPASKTSDKGRAVDIWKIFCKYWELKRVHSVVVKAPVMGEIQVEKFSVSVFLCST